MQKTHFNILAAVCVFMMTLTGPAGADTHYVDFDESIQAAIDAADNGDEIEVQGDYYSEAINFNGKAVRLYSLNGPWNTTIDGWFASSVVTCNSGEGPNTKLEGFKIINGDSFNGGGMHNNGSSPTVTNCIFEWNAADYGGGMYNGYGSNPTVTDCNFIDNTARVWGAGMFNKLSNPTVTSCEFISNDAGWDGGGMLNESSSSPTVTDCNFTDNTAAYSGGGMYSKTNSSPTVNNCTFSGNRANGTATDRGGGGMYNLDNSSPMVTDCEFTGNTTVKSGGGMRNSNSSPTVTDCTFSGNSAGSYGGGMYNGMSNPIVTNCTFSGNSASHDGGGGMYNYQSSPTVTNCTFSGNSSGYEGGGMCSQESSRPNVFNCILWGDTPDEIYDDPTSSTFIYHSNVQDGWPGPPPGGCIDADPWFVDAAGGDLRLSSSASPCVDAGDNSVPGLPATDLAGNPRIVDGDRDGTATVDMGAYELQAVAVHNITQDRWYDFIQVSIDDSNDGDEIEVTPGAYNEAINFNGKAVRLYSSGGPDVTAIYASGIDGAYHVVQCVNGEDANTILEGFTIIGGSAGGPGPDDKRGGGMYNDASSPTVTNCAFSENTAGTSGGGMWNGNGSSPTVENCTFSGNSSGSYGGGMCNDQSSPMVTDCNFSSNLATTSIGGGMHNRAGSDPTVTDCNFTGNSASQAGGMFNDSSSPAVTNSTFSSNSATGIGGGMYNFNNSSPTVTNCTFSGNSAGTDGGGMDNRVGSNPTVTSCTFSNNSATGYGGGIDNYDSNPTVTNCILWGDEPNEISNNSPTLTVTYSDVQGGWVGTGNIDVDPCFVDANNPNPNLWNLRLQPDSPCIDAGDTTAVSLPLDLDGNPRAIDNPHTPNTGLSVSDSLNVVDMGAYEFQPCRIAGDINCDGVVDFKDLAILAGNWLAGVGD